MLQLILTNQKKVKMEFDIDIYNRSRPTIINYKDSDMKNVHCIDVLDHKESSHKGLHEILMLIAYVNGDLIERTYLGKVEVKEIKGVTTTIYAPIELI